MSRLAVCLFLAVSAYGQMRFETFSTENGLPQNSVLAIRRTHDGYLWFTTYQGLVRFDGVRFKVFDPSNTPELRTTVFATFSLFEDHDGALWAGTWSAGTIRYKDGVFQSFTTQNGLPTNTVVRVDEDSNGDIWFYGYPGLSRLHKGRIEIVEQVAGEDIRPFLLPPPQLGSDSYLFGLWRFTQSGLQRFAYGEWANVPLPALASHPDRVQLNSLAEDTQGRLWFSLPERPGTGYCLDRKVLHEYGGLPSESFANYRDHAGRVWVSDRNGLTGWVEGQQFHKVSAISTTAPFRVLEDGEGGLWIGTLEDGLTHAVQAMVKLHKAAGDRAVNMIQNITMDARGKIWAGSNGLFSLAEPARVYRQPKLDVRPRGVESFSGLYPRQDGSILCGFPNGVRVFRNGRFEDAESLLQSIRTEINAMLQDRAGHLWLGGDAGLYRYANCKLDLVATGSALPGDVRALYEDSRGVLWVGTDIGLYRKAGTGFRLVFPQGSVTQLLVRSITEDAEGVLWVGTARKGILRIENDRVTSVDKSSGLYANDAAAILADRKGSFWVGCLLGIYRVKKQDLNDFAAHKITRVHSTLLQKLDGLDSLSCIGKGQFRGIRDAAGHLLFPSSDGVAEIDPDRVAFDRRPPPVLIEECAVQQHSIPCKKEVRLQPGASDLEIHYTGLNLNKSSQLAFRYQLVGLDSRWIEAGHRRVAYFSHLPPGEYRFAVTAANSDGIWNSKGAQLTVTVLPYYYQTAWFSASLFALSAGGLAWLWRARVHQYERQQAMRQALAQQVITSQESERKRIASELHDSLGQHLSVIKNTALLISQGRSSGVNGVDFIAEEASHAISEMRKISYNLRPYQLDLLGLSKALAELARRTQEASGIVIESEIDDLTSMFPKDKEIHVYRIVQESLNNVVRHSRATKAKLLVERSAAVTLLISDNGEGFMQTRAKLDHSTGGFGLLGMQERVHILGGNLQIVSGPGVGTNIVITFHREGAGQTE